MLPESLQFLRLIWAFQNGLEQTSEAMASSIGVTARQRFALRIAGLVPHQTAEQLSEMLGVARSVVDAEVAQLLTLGLLANLPAAPGASAQVAVTQLGAATNAAWDGTVESAVSRALDAANPYERAAFRRMLERVTTNLHPAP